MGTVGRPSPMADITAMVQNAQPCCCELQRVREAWPTWLGGLSSSPSRGEPFPHPPHSSRNLVVLSDDDAHGETRSTHVPDFGNRATLPMDAIEIGRVIKVFLCSLWTALLVWCRQAEPFIKPRRQGGFGTVCFWCFNKHRSTQSHCSMCYSLLEKQSVK